MDINVTLDEMFYKNIVHLCRTTKYAKIAFENFIAEHLSDIELTNTCEPYKVNLKNKEIHYFLSEIIYDNWCYRKDYYINDDHYYSGRIV